jgi:hypothetical protein
MYKFLWRIRARLDRYVYDERSSSRVRLLFVLSLTLSMILLGYNFFEEPSAAHWVDQLLEHYPYLFWTPALIFRFFHFVFYGFRHMIIPVSAFIGVLIASAIYVQDVYELPSFRSGLQYMLAAFLGLGYPRLKIVDGQKLVPKGSINLIDTIGGPGYVQIRPGNVVLFESLRSPSSVRARTVNFISRFETIKEIVSLDDQHGFIENIRARTKDGIEVVVRDVHYRYRLRTGRRFGDHEKREALNPYPYSVEAVKKMAYNRTVRNEKLATWHQTVRLAFDGGIKYYIRSHKFDNLTHPDLEESDPRAEIASAMNRGIRLRLRDIGAELLWFDIGHFGVSDSMKETVEEQRVDTWSAQLDGDAMVVRSYGEAHRLAYQDMGRAEGQADLLLSIMQALDDAGSESDFEEGETEQQRLQNLRAIVWTKVAQTLDAVADEQKKPPPQDEPPPNIPSKK